MNKSMKLIIGAVVLICIIEVTVFSSTMLGDNNKTNDTGTMLGDNNKANDTGTFYEIKLGKIYKDKVFTALNVTNNLSETEGWNIKDYVDLDVTEKANTLLSYLNSKTFVEIDDESANDNFKNLEIRLSTPPEEWMLIIEIISKDIIYITAMEGPNAKYRYYKTDGESLDLDYIYDLLE